MQSDERRQDKKKKKNEYTHSEILLLLLLFLRRSELEMEKASLQDLYSLESRYFLGGRDTQ